MAENILRSFMRWHSLRVLAVTSLAGNRFWRVSWIMRFTSASDKGARAGEASFSDADARFGAAAEAGAGTLEASAGIDAKLGSAAEAGAATLEASAGIDD